MKALGYRHGRGLIEFTEFWISIESANESPYFDRRELWQRLASSEAPQLQQLRSCFLKHLNGDAQLIIDIYEEFSSPFHEPRQQTDDTLVIKADMLAPNTLLFLESVCKLEARPIKHKIVCSSTLNEDQKVVATTHKRGQERKKQVAQQQQQHIE
jgi:hypothetical protein